tara:strand:- start:10 stop:336 length:327 start_codon:yes stop_codon:yes gene_type:complete
MTALSDLCIYRRFAVRMRNGSLLECLFTSGDDGPQTADACREQVCATAEWTPSQKMWVERAIDSGSYDVAIEHTVLMRSVASDEAEATAPAALHLSLRHNMAGRRPTG